MRGTLWMWLAVACMTVDCAGTSTGNPFSGQPHPSPPCSVGDPTALSSLDSPTPVDFTAGDILALAEGVHEADLQWLSDMQPTFVPNEGSTRLTIDVSAPDPRPRYVQPPTAIVNGGAGAPLQCRLRIEVDVRVHVESDDGALDERFNATLLAHDATTALLGVDIDGSDVHGSFKLAPNQGDYHFDRLSLSMTFTPSGVTGELIGDVSSGNETTAYLVGRW